MKDMNKKDKGKQKMEDLKKNGKMKQKNEGCTTDDVSHTSEEPKCLETIVPKKKDVQQLIIQFENRRYDINTRLLCISSKINTIQQLLLSGSISTNLNCVPARELQILQTETCQRLIHALEKEDYYMRIELVKLERDITFQKWCLKNWIKD